MNTYDSKMGVPTGRPVQRSSMSSRDSVADSAVVTGECLVSLPCLLLSENNTVFFQSVKVQAPLDEGEDLRTT